jgi:hypothetical protein
MVAAERRDSALKRRSRSESSWLPAAVRDPACNTYPSPLPRSPNAAPVLPRRRYLLSRVAASAAPFLEEVPADPNHSSRGEGLTVPLIERAERDAELGAKWSRDWRAGGTRYSDLPGALGNAPDDRVTRAAGTPKYARRAASPSSKRGKYHTATCARNSSSRLRKETPCCASRRRKVRSLICSLPATRDVHEKR